MKHFVLFEGTSEEFQHQAGAVGLDVTGDRGMDVLSPGDILWVVTRMGDQREAPAICGRLVVQRVEVRSAESDEGFADDRVDAERRLVSDHSRSARCAPFACEMIKSWDIWRQQFRGPKPLSQTQGEALEQPWRQARREKRAEG